MMKDKGIALKLILSILSISTLVFVVIFGYNYLISRRIIIRNVEMNARNLAKATVNRIDMVLRSVERVPESLAFYLEDSSHTDRELIDLLRSVVKNDPEIYGATIAFEPYAFHKDSLYFAPYFHKEGGKLRFTYLGGESYRYFFWDWYQIPKELNRPIWSEPYYDEGGGEIIMATYSVPFYKMVSGERQFMGIVTADISLTWLREVISSIRILETGYGFLISKNGTIVTHPFRQLIMNETIFSVAEARGDPELREIGREMTKEKSGFVPIKSFVTNKNCWMVYAPLSTSGWSLGALFPQDELMTDITSLNRIVFLLGLAGFFVLLVVIVWLAGSITRPLRALARATADLATGNLDVTVPPIKSRDEVGKLADSFSYMIDSLKQHIKELTETTAAKERIEGELEIAHDIQMGILPKVFPPFPHRREFDIFATLIPAKEVGGDLYNFFFMDDDHLCFAVGDVSGKGVPASLFMAISMTLIKTKATQGLSPEKVLSRVNQDLSMDNPSLMFVTLFLGILNIRTGEVEYCNGGHNPPFIIHANGDVKAMENTGGMALGVMEDFSYQSKRMVLQKGETLFLYTDGVTEAINNSYELFSEERLMKEIATLKDKPVEELVASVMERISAFTQDMSQSDDITMMILRLKD